MKIIGRMNFSERTICLNSFVTDIQSSFKGSDDFFSLPVRFIGAEYYILGLNSLIDLTKTNEFLTQTSQVLFDESKWNQPNVKESISEILNGKLIIYHLDNHLNFTLDPIPKTLSRSIDKPANQNILQGPQKSFIEELDTNLGMMRKQIISNSLRSKTFIIGADQPKEVAILYLEGITDVSLVTEIVSQIEIHKSKNIAHLQDMSKVMGFSKINLIPKFNTSEIPQEAAAYLNKGRILLFLDGLPFALVLPHLFTDMFFQQNDHNFSYLVMCAIRLLRIIGAFTAIIFPALYVAVVAVNPELLKIELALSIAYSREGVPYPAFIEIILMLLILELISEASIRLPASIGPTITMVGGIIIGQAVVEAKLVSNILIIVISATLIANSTVVGFQNNFTLRIFKYVIVTVSAIYGLLGTLLGVVFFSAYLSSKTIYGIPYVNLFEGGEKSG